MAAQSIRRRIARLEEAAIAGGECLRCGWGADNSPSYELEWIDPDSPDDREEFCETCGRQLVYVLTWGDEA